MCRKYLVVSTTSRRPGCSSGSPPTPRPLSPPSPPQPRSSPPTPTPTETFTSLPFEFIPRSLSEVCWPVVVFFEKQQLDAAFESAKGVGGESFCCPPPPPPPPPPLPTPPTSFELVSAGTFANSVETPFCKLGYSNSRPLFRPPGPPAATPEVGNITRAITNINIFIMATNTTIAIKQCPAGRFLFNIGSGRSVEISNQVFLGTLITLRYFLSYRVFLGILGITGYFWY